MCNLDELKRLANDLKNNEELRGKLDEAIKRIVDAGQTQNDGETMVAAAKELGYEISIAALEQSKAEAEELDPKELQQVTGGDDDSNEVKWCLGNYNCFYEYHGIEDAHGHNNVCLQVWHCLPSLFIPMKAARRM